MGDSPWLCHLCYIKPHWPYIAPAPYHDMYGPGTVQPIVRDPQEQEDANPVYDTLTRMSVSQTLSQQGVRETAMSAYMVLIKQNDGHLGQLFDWIEDGGRMDETMIVFTSDHGDYLGDHWLGKKELFHECSVRAPLIIVDPRSEADATPYRAMRFLSLLMNDGVRRQVFLRISNDLFSRIFLSSRFHSHLRYLTVAMSLEFSRRQSARSVP